MEHQEQNTAGGHADKGVIETKTCKTCKEKKLRTKEFFHKSSKGFHNDCKICRNTSRRKSPIARSEIELGFAYCYQCETVKRLTIDNFTKSTFTEKTKFKTCKTCRNKKSLEYSCKNKAKTKEYKSKYAKDNKARKNKLSQEWKAKNKEKVKASWSRYRKNRLHIIKAASLRRYKASPEKYRAKSNEYLARKRAHTVGWFEADKVKQLYVKATVLGLEVDHIVPLKSDIVCGLHCWHNLQLLDRNLNASKNNRYWPDMA